MSVSVECKAGINDVIYIIDNFITPVLDKDGKLDIENSFDHKVGDRVYYIDWYHEMVGDNPYVMIKFKDDEGREFSAIESYFVTADVWQNLLTYFSRYFTQNS